MRTIIILLVVVFSSGCYTTGAGESPSGGQSRAVGFVVRLDSDPESAYRQVARVLSDRGYVMATSDPVLLSITSDWKALFGSNTVRVRAMIDDSNGTSVRLRGDVQLGVNVGMALIGPTAKEDPSMEIEETGMRGSVARRAWEELEAVALALGANVERIY